MPIQELVIKVGDLDAAIDFYVKACRMVHVRTVEADGGAVAEMDLEGQRVTLVSAPDPGVQLVIASDDVRAERRRLRRRKLADDAMLEVAVDGGAYLEFTDPWGNVLGYLEAREEQ